MGVGPGRSMGVRRFRRRGRWAWFLVGVPVGLAVGATGFEPSDSPLARLGAAVTGVVLVAAGVRAQWITLDADEHGVRIVNWWSTRRIAWEDITAIGVQYDGQGNGPGLQPVRDGISFHLANGREIGAIAFDREPWEVPDRRLQVINELQDLRAQNSSGTATEGRA